MVVFPFDLVLGLGPVVPLVWGWDGALDLVVLVAARVVLFKGRDQIVLLELELTRVRQLASSRPPILGSTPDGKGTRSGLVSLIRTNSPSRYWGGP